MRSGTSFFEPAVFKKSVTRFWPLWVAYAGIWFLLLPLNIVSIRGGGEANSLYFDVAESVLRTIAKASPIMAAVFSILAAMAVFGWMYSPRSAGFTAALPVKREAMFLSCFGAGLTMLLAGNVLTFLFSWAFAASRGAACTGYLLQWLAATSLDCLSFFGFAALCAMLTGSLLILPLVYAALQFAEIVVENLAEYLVSCLCFGVTRGSSRLGFLSPLWTRLQRVWAATDHHTDDLGNYVLDGCHLEGWGIVAAYALAGAVFAALALWLYKRRRMETASDTVAVPQLKPVFRWCLAIGCALCLAAGVYTILDSGSYTVGDWPHALLLLGLLLLGALIGWCGADMLMHKSLRVLRLHPRGLALLGVILCALTVSCELDAFGLERRVPEDFGRVYIESWGESVSLTGQEAKAAVQALHKSIVAHKTQHETADGLRQVSIEYYAGSDGPDAEESCLLRRSYRIGDGETQQQDMNSDLRALERIFNLRESIDYRKDIPFPVTAESIDYASVQYGIDGKYAYAMETRASTQEPVTLTQDEAWELYTQCLLPDIADGTLGRIWLVQDEEYENTVYAATIHIEFSSRLKNGSHDYDYFYTVPTVDSLRTNAWLTAHGVELLTVAQTEELLAETLTPTQG